MITCQPTDTAFLLPWRDMYRQEMNCQIVHDSLHGRPGWTRPYLFYVDDAVAGYGAVLVGGPWKGTVTAFECYVSPPHRSRLFECFEALVGVSGVDHLEGQTNDPLFSLILHAYGREISTESILFSDVATTCLRPAGAIVRRAEPADTASISTYELDAGAKWVVDLNGEAVAAGDILFHYNRPYGDIYMKVAEPYRRRGLGSYLVQELKRICYEQGSVPAARCNPANVASRKTLQRAGFASCGFIVKAKV